MAANNGGFTPDQLEALLQYASKKLGTTPEKLKQTVSGSADQLAASLPQKEAEQFRAMASDRQKAEQFLQSPQAQQLLRRMKRAKSRQRPRNWGKARNAVWMISRKKSAPCSIRRTG